MKQIQTYAEFEKRVKAGFSVFAGVAGIASLALFVFGTPGKTLSQNLLLGIPVSICITRLILGVLFFMLPRLKEQFRSVGRFPDLNETQGASNN